MLAGLVACGGSVALVDGTSSGGSSSGESSSSGGSSSGGSSSGGSSGTTSSGGSTSSSSGTIPFDVDLCDGTTKYERLAGVTPAPGAVAVDYMELRDEYQSGAWTPPPQPPTVIAKSGTPCASATDKPACEAALANARSSGWPVESIGNDIPRERYLVATIGDNLEFATSLGDLKDFIAPIDTAKDAALLVTASGRYRVKCGKAQARKTTTGWEITAETGHTCGASAKLEEHVLAVTTGGAVSVVKTTLLEEGDPNCAIGRRPAGLCERSFGAAAAHGPLARFFAEAAYLEAASVFAFDRLADELTALGAPVDLVEAARASREDEVKHARMTKKLATRFGADVEAPAVTAPEPRDAFAIALENAVEGCVRETFGALVAHWQAQHAKDRTIAAAMQVIAEDETRHAALAWDVAAWLEPQLGDEERRAVSEARERAIGDLRAELAKEIAGELVAFAGMPRAAQAVALLEALDRSHLRAAA